MVPLYHSSLVGIEKSFDNSKLPPRISPFVTCLPHGWLDIFPVSLATKKRNFPVTFGGNEAGLFIKLCREINYQFGMGRGRFLWLLRIRAAPAKFRPLRINYMEISGAPLAFVHRGSAQFTQRIINQKLGNAEINYHYDERGITILFLYLLSNSRV